METKKSGLSLKKVFGNKTFVMFILMICCVCMSTFAADTSTFDSTATKLLELFSSTWIKAICVVALVIEAIALLMAGQQGGGGIVKKFIPWVVGTVILLAANGLTSFFVGDLNISEGFGSASLTPMEIEMTPIESALQNQMLCS